MELRSGTIMDTKALPALSQEGFAFFQQGVGLVLGRWTALQLAVHNEWGGPSSQHKAHELQTQIVTWMNQSKVPRYLDELEDLLDENLVVLFNTEAEDGSLEEVAECIMSIYEECLTENYETVRALMSSTSVSSHSASVSQQCENMEDENLDTSASLSWNKDTEEMDVDHNQSESGLPTRPANKGKRNETLTPEEEADGWQLVSSRMKRNTRRT